MRLQELTRCRLGSLRGSPGVQPAPLRPVTPRAAAGLLRVRAMVMLPHPLRSEAGTQAKGFHPQAQRKRAGRLAQLAPNPARGCSGPVPSPARASKAGGGFGRTENRTRARRAQGGRAEAQEGLGPPRTARPAVPGVPASLHSNPPRPASRRRPGGHLGEQRPASGRPARGRGHSPSVATAPASKSRPSPRPRASSRTPPSGRPSSRSPLLSAMAPRAPAPPPPASFPEFPGGSSRREAPPAAPPFPALPRPPAARGR